MSDKLYGDWESLVAGAQEQIAAVLKDDVLPVAEEIFRRRIKTDIYDRYSPKPGAWVKGSTYIRRHALDRNIFHRLEGLDTLFVTSGASPNRAIVKGYRVYGGNGEGGLLKLLESSNLGIWKSGFPRPTVSLIQKEYDKSASINDAIRRGLKEKFK